VSSTGRGGPALQLGRWTITSGSNAQSRGAVVIQAGDDHWQASSTGNGAVDALYKAVDAALAGILAGHPRLVAYDVHAVAPGPDAEGEVSVVIQPPESAAGERGGGRFAGRARSTNIIAASVEAYVDAINAMLAEEPWAEARRSASRGTSAAARPHDHRAELDRDLGHDPTTWFDR
jgi:hypothetical protein